MSLPPENHVYEPETAADFLQQLDEVAALQAEPKERYARLNNVFNRLLMQHCTFAHVQLVGPFAQTDYLLKQRHAGRGLSRQVNEMRVHLRQSWRGELSAEQMAACWQQDWQRLRLFVQFLYGECTEADETDGEPTESRSKKLLAEYVRVIVNRWDERLLYVTMEDDGSEARVIYVSPEPLKDWSYLQEMLHPGSQLNLIRPRMEDGALVPELVVLEPDYLVDISSVARCIENYAASPVVHLLHRIEPSPESEAITLGNLAGQLLDEELQLFHEGATTRDYAASVKDYFRHNALSLLTTTLGRDFHANAMLQQQHIRRVVREDLTRRVEGFDASNVMVEPSFFCEMLGLQGRMDFLQLDYRLLIEQKSGKGAFVPGNPDPDTPRIQDQHYVQMLLYMALLRYNFRREYEANNRELYAFLLYSRYRNSLQGKGFAPELLLEALRLRNGIVHQEFLLAEGGYDVLGKLTPELLNEKEVTNSLWERFQRPQLMALLSPIHAATDTERAYYYRMLAFVSKEHLLSKLGNRTKENSGFASAWQSPLEEKLASGNIYCGLTLEEDGLQETPPQPSPAGEGGEKFALTDAPNNGNETSPSPVGEGWGGVLSVVSFRFQERACNDMSNFRAGDIVVLYAYPPETVPDMRRTLVHRCTIQSITATHITLHLRHSQPDAHILLRHRDWHWAIEHDFFESSYGSLYRGLHAFLSAPQERRQLLMLARRPEVDESRQLVGDYGQFNELSRRVKQARDLFLIIGPPGTGKTSFGMFHTLQEELCEEGASVLVMAYTNRAVDEICGKLQGRIPYVRIGGPLSCAPQYHDQLLVRQIDGCQNIAEVRALLQNARVVVGTTTSLTAHQNIFQVKQFSLAIIDEASQILEPHLLPLLGAQVGGQAAIRKFVLIGDHKQLPAVVQQTSEESQVDDPLLHAIGLTNCRLSLFERLLHAYGGDPRFTYMLTRQGRMHPSIALFPNQMFYGGKLENVFDAVEEKRVQFIHSPLPDSSPSDKVNQVEADIIADLVTRIYQQNPGAFVPEETVGVIVPYRNQIATIRTTLERTGIPTLADITIDTVERYQGSQRRWIIYGFTIQRYYQLKFLTDNCFVEDGMVIDRKLNVALTRAQEHLIIIGHEPLITRNALFRQLVAFCKA